MLNTEVASVAGLYLSDIPLHDATRDLVLMSERFEQEYKLTRKLEIMTEQLQQTYRDLEDEKKKTDRWATRDSVCLSKLIEWSIY